jgi:5-methylcytosine-specific restriction endonuclease McrA
VNALLDRQVLVLNRLWQPVNTCAARRAFTLISIGHAQVVDNDADANFTTHDFSSWLDFSIENIHKRPGAPVVHSISQSFLMPRIIVLSAYDRLPKKEIKFTRDNIFQRDGYTCQYCRKLFEPKELNLDHVIPRDKGGKTNWENVVCSCIKCNTKKANKLPAQANMFPLKKPAPPRWRPLFSTGRDTENSYDKSWRFFIDPSHSHVKVTA